MRTTARARSSTRTATKSSSASRAEAVHGFAAASWYYFGRPVQTLRPQEIALLVGMVRGPSYYDPRRWPERALARRNQALDAFHATGLLNTAQWNSARAA